MDKIGTKATPWRGKHRACPARRGDKGTKVVAEVGDLGDRPPRATRGKQRACPAKGGGRLQSFFLPFTRYASRFTRTAFTLVEVNLAILLVAVGLLTLFALFPLGLRESEMGIVDTHEAMFADHVLSGLEGNALDITDWDIWNSIGDFKDAVAGEIYPIEASRSGWGPDGNGGYVIAVTNVGNGVEFPKLDPPDSEAVIRDIRYKLTVSDNGKRKTAELMVKSGRYGDFNKKATVYFTEFVYLGM